ncbi:MAG TPA: hypothetical protein PKD61_20215 [Polyangiaceae bacterium]|nr:hypothetical protein [Polyangiaceae bacterium]
MEEPATDSAAAPAAWWGSLDVAQGKAVHYGIGPLALWIARRPNEWRVVYGHEHPLAGSPGLTANVELPQDFEKLRAARFGVGHAHTALQISPVMPDKPVITRPRSAITIPAVESVTLFVGCPVWVRLVEPEPGRLLMDVPSSRPVLTWWGENTLDGEACYASRTFGKLRLDKSEPDPHRVITAVQVDNQSDAPLVIERLHLPVRSLSVFAAADGRLWTEAVRLIRKEGQAFAELRVESDPGTAAGKAKRVGEPRHTHHANELVRAFGKLFRM